MGSLSIVFGALVLCAPLLALGGTPHSGADVGSLMQRTRTKTANDKSAAEITSTSKADENEDEDEDNGEDEGADKDEDEDVNKRDLLTPRSPKTPSANSPSEVTCLSTKISSTSRPGECRTSCITDQNCYTWRSSSTSWRSLVETGKQQQTALERSHLAVVTLAQSRRRRRRRPCYHVISSDTGSEACPSERCNLADNRSCHSSSYGLESSLFSGASCTPSCVNGYSPSVNSEVPASLTCTAGTLSPVPAYDCLRNVVTGSLTVKVLNANNLQDEDWWSGASDAYVMLHLNNNKCTSSGPSNCRTAAIESNNPVWNDEEFQFAISSRADTLAFDVYDEDAAAFDDWLGGNDGMDLHEIIQQGGTKAYGVDLGANKGTLNVELTFTER